MTVVLVSDLSGEEIKEGDGPRRDKKLRGPLMTFGNHHPSDGVRSLVGELETAVNADISQSRGAGGVQDTR